MRQLKIGNLSISGYAALAPMAGVADRAMRELCRGYGAAYTVGELCSGKGVSMNDKKSQTLLTVHESERPMGVQLFGDDPDIIAGAAVKSLEYAPDFIDINMGCPAPKIAGNGGGAALMKHPQLAADIVKETVAAVKSQHSAVPVTVKMRIGWDERSLNAARLAQLSEAAGAALITVHGRTRMQMYAPPVDAGAIRAVKEAVNIPVAANGDITDGKSAAAMFEQTGCDFLMVGRGACGAPWVFQQINAYLEHGTLLPEPPLSQRLLVLIGHVKSIVGYKGERIGICEARKHAAWYLKGIKNAAAYRAECVAINSVSQLEELCFKVLKENE